MNERIQELYMHAIQYADRVVPAERRYNDIYYAIASAKHAELIIKECISVPYNMWDKSELNADIAVKIDHRIKDHFGVENEEDKQD